MLYHLEQTNYRCHCGQGAYLGYRYYPQPFFLLQLASKLRREGHEVSLHDYFVKPVDMLTDARYLGEKKIVANIGEYAADAQHRQSISSTFLSPDFYSGSYVWLRRPVPDRMIIEPEEVHGVEPAWDLLDFGLYPWPEGRKRAVIRLTLGCPNKCIFCPVPVIYKGKYHKMDLEWAKRQFEHLAMVEKVREFAIIDDNLCADPQIKDLLRWLADFCPIQDTKSQLFMQEGMEVNQALDLELCKLLKQARFYDVRVGIESTNTAVMREMHKVFRGKPVDAVKNLQEAGFAHPRVFLIKGLPGNTSKHEMADEKLFKDIGCEIRSQQLKVYPKTPLDREMRLL